MRRPNRRGYLLVYVLVFSFVMGALVLAYQESFRQRNVQVRLNTDRVAARFLARAAIDAMRWAFRESPDPSRLAGNLDLENGPILPFLLADAKSLEKKLARKMTEGGDSRALLDQLLGPEALAGLDRAVAEVKDAQVQLFVDITHAQDAPAVGPAVSSPIKDPALKTLSLNLRAVAKVRRAAESYAVTESLTVYSQLPAAAKFTLAGINVGSVNNHRITTGGAAGDGPPPLVLFHAPADCDVLAATPFEGTAGSERPLVEKAIAPKDLIRANAARGFVYLDSSEPDRAVRLNVGSGGTPFGENHTIYRSEDGKVHTPPAEPVPEPPGKLASFKAADPANPSISQSAALIGTAAGFHKMTNADGALAPLPPAKNDEPAGPGYDVVSADQPAYEEPAATDPANPDAEPLPSAPPPPTEEPKIYASQIKPYGTGTFPSPTVMLGNVQRVFAWLTHIGIDRDASQDDENAQATAIGKNLPVPDGHDPVLVNCDEASYRLDLVAEQGSGPVQYRRLRSFGEQGQVVNMNAYADLDGDGEKEAGVTGEEGSFNVDLTLWKYAALFDGYAQYKAVMSREVAYPANLSLHLPALPAQQAAELLRNVALERPPSVPVADFVLKDARVECRDRLHLQLGSAAELRTWLDLKGAAPDALRTALVDGLAKRHPADVAVTVRGQRELERQFVVGGALDLRGLRVKVLPDGPRGGSVVSWSTPMPINPAAGGVLEVDRLEVAGLSAKDAGEAYAPLIVRTKELVLAGRGPYDGLFATSKLTVDGFKGYAVLRGALFLEEPTLNLDSPLVVVYDPRMDPTGEGATQQYRIAVQPGPRGYDLLERP